MSTTARVDIILRAIGSGDVKRAMGEISIGAREVATSMLSLAAGGGAYAAWSRLAFGAATLADRMDDLARRVNATFEGIQVLDYLARRTGQSVDIFTGGIDRLRLQLAKAAAGSEEAYEPFRKLNLTLAEFDGLKSERQLELVARAAANAADKEQAFLQVSEILGVKITPQLRASLESLAAGYGTIASQAAQAGQVMTEANGKALADARKQWEDYGRYLTVWWTENGFGPIMRWLRESEKAVPTVPEAVERSADIWARAAGVASREQMDALRIELIAENVRIRQELAKLDELTARKREIDKRQLTLSTQVGVGTGAQRAETDAEMAALVAEYQQINEQLATRHGLETELGNIVQLQARIQSGAYDERLLANAAAAEATRLAAEEAERRRQIAISEEAAGVWLEKNEAKAREQLEQAELIKLSDEVRLKVLRDQLAELEKEVAAAVKAAVGDKTRLRAQLEGAQKRLALTKEIAQLEAQIRRDQDAATKRILDANARIGGPEAEALMIRKERQPLGGSGAGEETRDVDVYQRSSVGDAIADARDDLEQMGNIFDGMYQSIVDITTATGRDLGGTISGLILRTKDWSSAWRELGSAILTNVVSTFSQMVAQYAVSQLAIFALSKIFKAKDVAATTAQATAAATAWTPAAIAASIATFGAAATSGTAAFLTALALGTASATALTAATSVTPLATGGDYYAGKPYLVGEYGAELAIPRESGIVVNHRETAEIARQLAGGGASGGGETRWRQPVLVSSELEAERIRRGSQAEVDIVRIMRDHKYEILG